MPAKRTIVPGARFGRWTVLDRPSTLRGKHRFWSCRCDCGLLRSVRADHLQNGLTQSCGCLHRDIQSARLTTHGLSRSPEYVTWMAMRGRCLDPAHPNYANYGGRGVTICPAWDDFMVFYRDMGEKPSSAHSIDRIDPDLGYFPENCRWATLTEQRQNRRSS